MALCWSHWSGLWSLVLPSTHSLTLLGLFITVFVLLFDFMMRRRSWSCYPPGPTSLPFVGNMLQLDFKNTPKSFTLFQKKYGNIFSLQFCSKNVVVLNGFEVMKEALIHKSEDFSDRATSNIVEQMGFKENCEGIISARYGNAWKEQRRFALTTLRNFGLGKKSLEKRVLEEAGFLCSAFKAAEGCPFDPHHFLKNASSNVICSITFGDRYEYGDEKFKKLLHLFKESMDVQTGLLPQLLNVLPCMQYFPGLLRKVMEPNNKLMSFIRDIVQEHKATWDPAVMRDFIDAYLSEIGKAQNESGSSFSEDNLLFATSDLFIAGTETTSSTMYWALLFMILYPNIQARVQEEIDREIGHDRTPVMEDLASMPYTNAVIHEIQRYSDVIPLGLPHMTNRNTELQGFFIPKATVVMTNLSSVLKDVTVWEKPNQFYPEHFLDTDGKFVKREAFMVFSAGRRVCLGEQLAKMELFLFCTSLLQRFNFTIPDGQPRPQEDPIYTYMQSAHPFQICAKVR